MKPRARLLLCLILMALPFVVYRYGHARYGVGGAETGDHQTLMRLRVESPDEITFLWKAANFDRYRGHSESFLFRPGLGLMLGGIDSAFRANFYVTGAVSLLIHGLVTVLLFFWLTRLTTPFWAFTGALVFSTHFCGSEMVIWRHVSPYMMGLVFFVLGLDLLNRKRPWIASALFSLAPLFHETFAAALGFAALLALLPPVAEKLREAFGLSRAQGALVFALPTAFFMALNVGSYYWVLHHTDNATHFSSANLVKYGPLQYVLQWVLAFIHLTGASTGDFLVPQLFTTTLDERIWIIRILGPITFILFALAFREIQKRRGVGEALLFSLVCLQVTTLFIAFTTMRIMPRGNALIGESHYYRYFSNFALVLTLVVLCDRLKRPSRFYWLKALLLVAVVGNQIFFGVGRLRRWGKMSEPREARVAANLYQADHYLHGGRCYAGNEKKESDSLLPPSFLYRKSCDFLGGTEKLTGETLGELGVVNFQ